MTKLTEENNAKATVAAPTLAEFLENFPPGKMAPVSGALDKKGHVNSSYFELKHPQITLHCPDPKCGGPRSFRALDDASFIGREASDGKNVFVSYLCSNCRQQRKLFALYVSLNDEMGADVFKFGELPAFGPPTPPKLLRLLGDERDTFLKGRRCEFQGLGIGAFSYYRRVVEQKRVQILEEILKVARKLGLSDAEATLQAARDEHQFSKSIQMVAGALPQALLIGGHNPLTLLHTALSDGLHDQSDDHCLAIAQDIRLVLAELAERIDAALKNDAELNSAVARLTQVKNKQSSSP